MVQTRVPVVVVCCGEPKRSMGWFHLTQLIDDPAADVRGVVEPWFLGPGKAAAGAERFAALRAANPSLRFVASVGELARPAEGEPLLALIAGRTCDAPALFDEVLALGATHIYVEKPGAESAAQLRAMRDAAAARGVAVVVGYNKNVASYARDALADLEARAGAPPRVTLEHCNDFAPGDELLAFLRGPGGEGMLHNMCCHELALASSLFGVSCERVAAVELDASRSELLALGGDATDDWSRVAFTLRLRAAPAGASGAAALAELSFSADRCAGNFSHVRLADGSGEEAYRMPSAAHEKWMAKAQAADAEIRPYFLQQAPDYQQLKSLFIGHVLAGKPGVPPGVVSIDGALEALRLADMLSPVLRQCWKAGQAGGEATVRL